MRIYFFFSDNEARYPFRRFLKTGFRHVEAIVERDGFIMHINPRLGRCEIDFSNEIKLHEAIAKMQSIGRRVVMYVCPNRNPSVMVWRGWAITCASYLAYTVGIDFRGVTPYQLYKTIKARGGEDV